DRYTCLFAFTASNSSEYFSLVISEARPDKYYTWNSESNSWEMTAAAVTQKASDEVAAAENYRSRLISFAKDTISVWQTELLLGTISDDDKASLTVDCRHTLMNRQRMIELLLKISL
ncbi:tail fiber assembly protein, partial [Klebsiella pneumoniae]